jgi:hypothetical protein
MPGCVITPPRKVQTSGCSIILSTYLGHADPGDTYWYLSAAPELLALAGERLERHLAGDA